jgi:hypothetical protein
VWSDVYSVHALTISIILKMLRLIPCHDIKGHRGLGSKAPYIIIIIGLCNDVPKTEWVIQYSLIRWSCMMIWKVYIRNVSWLILRHWYNKIYVETEEIHYETWIGLPASACDINTDSPAYETGILWYVNTRRDNHVNYKKYLSLLEYHSWSGRLSMPQEHRQNLPLLRASFG